MLPVFHALQLVAQTPGTNDKKALLLAHNSEDLRQIIWYAYDQYLTYRVQAVRMPDKFIIQSEATLSELYTLLDGLSSHAWGDTQAQQKIAAHLSRCDEVDADWVVRIIQRDLDCGCGPKTFNEVFPGLIPTFDVQLAYSINDHWEKVTIPAIVDEKHNGLRGVNFDDGQHVASLSREGNPFLPGKAYEAQIRILLGGLPYVLDGEYKGTTLNPKADKAVRDYHAGKSWGFTQAKQMLRSPKTPDADMLKYNKLFLWDLIPEDYFFSRGKKGTNLTTLQRRKLLKELFDNIDPALIPNLEYVPYEMVFTKDRILEMRDAILAAKGEGVMVKDPESCYEFGRRYNVLKAKKMLSMDLRIVGAIEGKAKSNKGMLGALMLASDCGEVKCKTGSGFTNKELIDLWELYLNGQLLGLIAEINYQERTALGSLFLPIYERLREDKEYTSLY